MNLMLASLSPFTAAAVKSHLVKISLEELVARPIDPDAPWVDFVTSGVLAITSAPTSTAVGIALVGSEGLSGLSSALGAPPMPFGRQIIVNGSAFRIKAARLRTVMSEKDDLREAIEHYAWARSLQVAQAVQAASRHLLDERLAGWILGVHDRIASDEIGVTHEMIAQFLGVRRPGVTVAVQVLEGEHLIRNHRKRVIVLDRAGLEARAGGACGVLGRSYAEVFPNMATNAIKLAA